MLRSIRAKLVLVFGIKHAHRPSLCHLIPRAMLVQRMEQNVGCRHGWWNGVMVRRFYSSQRKWQAENPFSNNLEHFTKRNWKLEAQKAEKRRQKLLERMRNPEEIVIPDNPHPKLLASIMGVRTIDILKILILLGEQPKSSVQPLSDELVDLVCQELYFIPKRNNDDMPSLEPPRRTLPEDLSKLPRRNPVVVFLGHVDHGKTTLLDSLRKTSVAAGEAGGITQHISASVITFPSGQIVTLIDTPGHKAFTTLRARGASFTDMAVLVVAADDGVRDQTLEALDHIRKAEVPLIVAINKVDKHGVDVGRVRQQLLRHGVMLESAGGDVQVVEVSGLTGQGLAKLQEAIELQAELQERRLKADPSGPAEGVVVEASATPHKGPAVVVLLTFGTLRVGDVFVAGTGWGKVRELVDTNGNAVPEIGPGMPATVYGLRSVPEPSESLIAIPEGEHTARAIVKRRLIAKERAQMKQVRLFTTQDYINQENQEVEEDYQEGDDQTEGDTAKSRKQKRMERRQARQVAAREREASQSYELGLLVRADTAGSLEGIQALLQTLPKSDIAVRIVQQELGSPSLADVEWAAAHVTGKANDNVDDNVHRRIVLVAFNVPVPNKVRAIADVEKVRIIEGKRIYEILDKLANVSGEVLPPLRVEEEVGTATVQQVYEIDIKKKEPLRVAGCIVTSGSLKAAYPIKVLRPRQGGSAADAELVYCGDIEALKRHKEKIKEAKKGSDCGVSLDGWDAFQPGDILVSYVVRTVPRKLVIQK